MNWITVFNGAAMGACLGYTRIYYRRSKIMQDQIMEMLREVEARNHMAYETLGNEISELDEDYRLTKTRLSDDIEAVRRNLPSIEC